MKNVTHTALWFFKHKADSNLHQHSFKQQKNIQLPPRSSACLFPHLTSELLKENKIHQKLKYSRFKKLKGEKGMKKNPCRYLSKANAHLVSCVG